MNTRLLTRLWAIVALMLGTILAASPVIAAKDRKPLTTPTDRQVTGMTACSVWLVWNPSTVPGNPAHNGLYFTDGETWLLGDQSPDGVDGLSRTRYDVYVNGLFDPGLVGAGSAVLDGQPGVENTYRVIAVDAADDRSAPANLTTCAGS